MESMKPIEHQTQLRLSKCRSQAFLRSAPRSLWEPSCWSSRWAAMSWVAAQSGLVFPLLSSSWFASMPWVASLGPISTLRCPWLWASPVLSAVLALTGKRWASTLVCNVLVASLPQCATPCCSAKASTWHQPRASLGTMQDSASCCIRSCWPSSSWTWQRPRRMQPRRINTTVWPSLSPWLQVLMVLELFLEDASTLPLLWALTCPVPGWASVGAWPTLSSSCSVLAWLQHSSRWATTKTQAIGQ